MTTCKKCKLEISPNEVEIRCEHEECEAVMHKKCSRQYQNKRYCRKHYKEKKEDNPTQYGL